MARSTGAIRLQKEFQKIQLRKDTENYVARPDPDNVFIWHFCIFGLKDCPYEGGFYHGQLKFPHEYPLKPPGIIMYTPSGRFKIMKKICMSFSDYHPELWNPMWGVSTIIIGLISFMNTEEKTAGYEQASNQERKRLAKISLAYNLIKSQRNFEDLFETYFEKMGISEERVKKITQPKIQEKLQSPKIDAKKQEEELKNAPNLILKSKSEVPSNIKSEAIVGSTNQKIQSQNSQDKIPKVDIKIDLNLMKQDSIESKFESQIRKQEDGLASSFRSGKRHRDSLKKPYVEEKKQKNQGSPFEVQEEEKQQHLKQNDEVIKDGGAKFKGKKTLKNQKVQDAQMQRQFMIMASVFIAIAYFIAQAVTSIDDSQQK